VTAGWTRKVKWMWRPLEEEVKFHPDKLKLSFNVPGTVLKETPALDKVDPTANRSKAAWIFFKLGKKRLVIYIWFGK